MKIHLAQCHPGDRGPWGKTTKPEDQQPLIMSEKLIKLAQKQSKLEKQLGDIKYKISQIQNECKHRLADGTTALNGWENCTLCGKDLHDPEEWK